MNNYIIQITLGILVILWSYYVLRIALIGTRIHTKTTKRKKYPLKTRLLKKLRKKAFKKYKIQYDGYDYYVLIRLHDSSFTKGRRCKDKNVILNSITILRRDYILRCLSDYRKHCTRLIKTNKELSKL